MTEPTRFPLRQLNLGSIGYFQVEPEATPGNQVVVQPGIAYSGGHAIHDQSAAAQTTPGFSPVTGGPSDGQRYDLVYLNSTGVASIQQGAGQALGSPFLQGAPGLSTGPALVDAAVPLAFVFVDETGAVVVAATDIFPIGGQFNVTKDLHGYLVDKGFFGAAPTGVSDDVSALFATETSGGGSSQPGIVTSGATNYVHLLDQANDQIKEGGGAEVYGRITEAAGTWTLSYYYQDSSGVEQTIDPSTLTPAPTDVRLIGVPKVYSNNDPTRPLFPSSLARISDQIAGDIPDGSTTQKGKVQFATDGDTAALEAVQGSDTRVNTPMLAQDSGGLPVGGGTGRFSTIREGSNVTFTNIGGGIFRVDATGASGVTSLSPGTKTGAVTLAGTGGITVTDGGGSTININHPSGSHYVSRYSGSVAIGAGPGASAVLNHALGGSINDYQITSMITTWPALPEARSASAPFQSPSSSGGVVSGNVGAINAASVTCFNENTLGITMRVNIARMN